MVYIHSELQSTLKFFCTLYLKFLLKHGISVQELMILILLNDRPGMTIQELTDAGIYTMYCNTRRAANRMITDRLLIRQGLNYYLTGSGELLLQSFYSFFAEK